jgi:exopolysaccharide/PEP-CTERM locus tyrosine autokinase
MRNLIEEAALRLQELQAMGSADPDPWPDILPADRSPPPRVGAAVMPIVPRVVPPMPRAGRRVDIDFSALTARGMLTPETARPQLATEYRILKRPLIRHALGKQCAPTPRGRLVMVTSAQRGEGRTFTAVNLAMSIVTDTDQPVLLIDADVSNPSVSALLGLQSGPGLLDVLAGTVELSDALLRTQIDGLSVLPIGDANVRATELIASGTMRSLLDDLTARDPDLMLIFDAPPLLTATEARELASHMGQLIVVVEAGRTAQSKVREALHIVEGVPERMLVLNGARRLRAGWDNDAGPRSGRTASAPEEAVE